MKFLVISTFILHFCATKLSARENFRPIAARHGRLSPKEMKLFRLMLARKRKYENIHYFSNVYKILIYTVF